MNGTDLCGHLMEERPGIKVLVMSGADISEIVSQNVLPFLPKPFDGQTLTARVRTILAAPAIFDNPLPVFKSHTNVHGRACVLAGNVVLYGEKVYPQCSPLA